MELLQALGGLLAAQAHATQELPHPSIARTHVESHFVESFAHKAPDSHRAQAQDVGHHCSGRVVSAGVSRHLLQSGAARGALRFQGCGVFGLIPSNTPGHRRWDLTQAPLHVPSSFGFPVAQHVEEPVAGDGIDVDLAAFESAAAGLVFNERGGGTRSFDVGELLVREQPIDGFSWSPLDRALQADALRELVVAAGPKTRRWRARSARNSSSGGSCQIKRRVRALADEVVHGKLFAAKNNF